MNTNLPPFKNGEHNSKSASTIDRVITPLKSAVMQSKQKLRNDYMRGHICENVEKSFLCFYCTNVRSVTCYAASGFFS